MPKAMDGDSAGESFVEMMDEDLQRHPHDPEPEAYWQSVRDAAEEPAKSYKLRDIPERDKGHLVWLRADGRRI